MHLSRYAGRNHAFQRIGIPLWLFGIIVHQSELSYQSTNLPIVVLMRLALFWLGNMSLDACF
jgi:hypothetical protein